MQSGMVDNLCEGAALQLSAGNAVTAFDVLCRFYSRPLPGFNRFGPTPPSAELEAPHTLFLRLGAMTQSQLEAIAGRKRDDRFDPEQAWARSLLESASRTSERRGFAQPGSREPIAALSSSTTPACSRASCDLPEG